jgi:TolB protein
VTVEPGRVTEVTLTLSPLWDAAAEGWLSGDHHFHLNYGGPFQVDPSAMEAQVAGEALDAASPLLANLHHRFGERELWSWRRDASPPFLAFGQEVRSHFLGHVALVGTRELFWPWIWGPGYPIHGQDDRPNAEALRFGRAQGGMGTYVHPVSGPDPFAPGNEGQIPVGFIPDAVLGEVDALEVVCLWSDDLGTAELWYRILNLGIPLAATAGSDVMTDFYRTMAVGATRVFVQTGADRSWPAYLDALRKGRSFVSTGPFLDFRVADGVGPGGVVPSGTTRWTLDLRSPIPVEQVELVVNGQVVETLPGLDQAGARSHSGTVELPEGGWIAVRARGGTPEWPVMAAAPFAHSSPVWIGARGSTDPTAAARSAGELLRALDVAEARLRSGYEGVETPRLQARFDEARARLEGWTGAR